MESDLAQTRVKLEEALEWIKSIHQAVMASACLLLIFVGSGGDVEP